MIFDDCDLLILSDLWRWKLMPTKALWTRHGASTSLSMFYKKLLRFEKRKLIRTISFKHGQYLWALNKAGFQLVKEDLPQMKQVGFGTEHVKHDYWVTAFHLSNFLKINSCSGILYTEQELRCLDRDCFSHEIPDPEKHRPDGYCYKPESSGQKGYLLALEIERSLKSHSAYQKTVDFYDLETNVDFVIWLAFNQSIKKRIQSKFGSGSSFRPQIHFIVMQKDFESHGWNAIAERATDQAKHPLINFMESLRKVPGKLPETQDLTAFFDLRKRAMNPKSPRPAPKTSTTH